MNNERTNNGSRQSTINILTRLQVVKPTELSLIPRKGKYFPHARNMSIEYGAHTAYYSMSPGNKGPGLKLTQKSSLQDEGRAVYTTIPSTFCTGKILYSLIANKMVAGVVTRGYIKDRNLCVILDLQMTFHSAASWIYQVLVLFITPINTNEER
jgi:hypothetical protein